MGRTYKRNSERNKNNRSNNQLSGSDMETALMEQHFRHRSKSGNPSDAKRKKNYSY